MKTKSICTTPFGRNIASLRKQKHMSGTALASLLGLKQASISNWELDKSEPSLGNLCKVADVLGVSTDFLLGRAEAATPPVAAVGGSVAIGTQANSGGDNSIRVGGAASAAEQSEREARLCAELAEKSAEILNLRGIVATLQKAIDTICARRGGKAAAGAGAE